MRIITINAIIAVILTNGAYADDESDKNELIKTYDPGELSSQKPVNPHLPRYGRIPAEEQPDHYGFNNFEDTDRPIKFEDNNSKSHNAGTTTHETNSDLIDISSEAKSFDRYQHITGDKLEPTPERRDNENNIKFEDSNNDLLGLEDHETNETNDKSISTVSRHVVFEDDDNNDSDSADGFNDSKVNEEIIGKKFKFEDTDDELDLERNTERVVFVDDSYKNQDPIQMKPERKRRLKALPRNPTPVAPNSPYPNGLGYSGYPGGYPNSKYINPGDMKAGYAGYLVLGYPVPGYTNPGYIPYPGMIYPTPGYQGYQPYSGSFYPPSSPSYGAYQSPEDTRPSVNPVTYTSPEQNGQIGHSDTILSSHENADKISGSPSSSVSQIHQPGASYPVSGYPYYGYPIPGYSQAYTGDPNSQYPLQNQAQYRPGHPGYQTGLYSSRPSRRPKSLTQRAVSAVTEALTSIALYDDYQCVPRLLCEVAGGTAATSPTLQKATAGLQPLLSVLQAYNAASSSPLFIFGRAAAMGVTAKGNPSVCYRTYSQCPSDPEKLINYLNNHNGGFFRFFGQPEVAQQQQNLEQFYNHLSGQYGFQKQPQHKYGYLKPYSYGLQGQQLNANGQNYGANYHHAQNGKSSEIGEEREEEIEARIQNKPTVNVLDGENDLSAIEDSDQASKWLFPENVSKRENFVIIDYPGRPNRASKTVKFPDDRSNERPNFLKIREYARKEKGVFFPEESNLQIGIPSTTLVNPEDYVFDHKHNFYVQRPYPENNDNVVYVVRGNGDPNHPEIVKVRPGQSV